MEIRFNQVVKKIKSDTALDGADFCIPDQPVIGLLGDYGSGKSTVLSLIAGYQKADRGEILIDQKKCRFREVRDAVKAGIGSVDPNLNVYDKFTIRQNLVLNPDYDPKKQAQIESDFKNLCDQIELPFEFDTLLGAYPAASKLMFEIMRLAVFGTQLILLDEPFKHIPENRKNQMADLFESLRHRSIQFIFSTQFTEEIFLMCDYCVELENGRVKGQYERPFQNLDKHVQHDIGGEPLPAHSQVNLLSLVDFQIYAGEEGMTADLKAGEMVGVYSSDHDSAVDLLLCCAGLHTAYQGALILNGFDLFGKPLQEFIDDGVVFIAEDRLEGNLIPDMPLREHFGLMGGFSEKTFQPPKFRKDAERLLLQLGINQHWETPVKSLSKKDQLKFLFSVLPHILSLLILINPTAGLDRATKRWVWQEIELRAKSGIGILVFSSDPEELQTHTHHIWLKQDGKWLQPFPSNQLLERLNQSEMLPLKAAIEENDAVH